MMQIVSLLGLNFTNMEVTLNFKKKYLVAKSKINHDRFSFKIKKKERKLVVNPNTVKNYPQPAKKPFMPTITLCLIIQDYIFQIILLWCILKQVHSCLSVISSVSSSLQSMPNRNHIFGNVPLLIIFPEAYK